MSKLSLLPIIVAGVLACVPAHAQDRSSPDEPRPFAAVVERARDLQPLRTLIVGRDGAVVVEEGFRGGSPGRPTNVKSASKSVVSALVGIAIDKGVLEGVDQPVAPLLAGKLPPNPDPRLAKITVGNLLSMQAGLERTSGPNYGAWISSRDWVRAALARPFVAEPGAEMLYSTGSSHLLSAILTKASGRSTLQLAREWLGDAGIEIAAWERDPQGIYLGGNQMAMTPRSLFRFGELYRNGGRTPDGRQVVPEAWVRESFVKRTTTRWSGDDYGYGWFGLRLEGHDVHYGWGYGGQMIYVVPDLGLTIAMTSDDGAPSARTGYKEALHGIVAEIIGETAGRPVPAPVPAATGAPADPAG
ncbi:serine hydrolase domain-containing protein [Aureimonas leprariae]|uniref:Serine hydrolase n=1 Tax=Plantimonas leprariae TaxID=2615207 RepID=A0A7V7TVJ9_9HYPH|nr:serine hydrolase [Aureimonas leprariae]KAB0678011.1 serine hydrolase [Aureimonas leprariae]